MKAVRDIWLWKKFASGGPLSPVARLFLPKNEFFGWAAGRSVLGIFSYAGKYWALRAKRAVFGSAPIDGMADELINRLARKDR